MCRTWEGGTTSHMVKEKSRFTCGWRQLRRVYACVAACWRPGCFLCFLDFKVLIFFLVITEFIQFNPLGFPSFDCINQNQNQKLSCWTHRPCYIFQENCWLNVLSWFLGFDSSFMSKLQTACVSWLRRFSSISEGH